MRLTGVNVKSVLFVNINFFSNLYELLLRIDFKCLLVKDGAVSKQANALIRRKNSREFYSKKNLSVVVTQSLWIKNVFAVIFSNSVLRHSSAI